jgi:hypothetical protein
MVDPRGPVRKIERVEEVIETVNGQVAMSKKLVHLSCGHVNSLNLFYLYRVGEHYRCFKCSGLTN